MSLCRLPNTSYPRVTPLEPHRIPQLLKSGHNFVWVTSPTAYAALNSGCRLVVFGSAWLVCRRAHAYKVPRTDHRVRKEPYLSKPYNALQPYIAHPRYRWMSRHHTLCNCPSSTSSVYPLVLNHPHDTTCAKYSDPLRPQRRHPRPRSQRCRFGIPHRSVAHTI